MADFPEWDDDGWKKIKAKMPSTEENFRRFLYAQNTLIRALLATIETLVEKAYP